MQEGLQQGYHGLDQEMENYIHMKSYWNLLLLMFKKRERKKQTNLNYNMMRNEN